MTLLISKPKNIIIAIRLLWISLALLVISGLLDPKSLKFIAPLEINYVGIIYGILISTFIIYKISSKFIYL